MSSRAKGASLITGAPRRRLRRGRLTMRLRMLALGFMLAACGSRTPFEDLYGTGTGGNLPDGGRPGAGGSPGSGGTSSNTGGFPETGGTFGTGGSIASGGNAGSGGSGGSFGTGASFGSGGGQVG